MLNPFNIIIKPVITEKATKLKEKENKYEFVVAKHSTKGQIKEAIKQIFNVDVEKVRTAILPGKLRRQGAHAGYKSDFKKAIVDIKKGQSIKIVEGV
ncbi:MAG: 50S ribosomal protein L23 [Elusimicrobia bacterium A5]|nr:MAG: 50S ribosomal protein L23 [Elusimicrobia bacterium A5]